MSTFHLKISTPDGLLFDGEVERIRARMIDGDVCLLAHHADYVSAVGAGEAAIALPDGQVKRAACIGGHDRRRSEPDRDDVRMGRGY